MGVDVGLLVVGGREDPEIDAEGQELGPGGGPLGRLARIDAAGWKKELLATVQFAKPSAKT